MGCKSFSHLNQYLCYFAFVDDTAFRLVVELHSPKDSFEGNMVLARRWCVSRFGQFDDITEDLMLIIIRIQMRMLEIWNNKIPAITVCVKRETIVFRWSLFFPVMSTYSTVKTIASVSANNFKSVEINIF